MRDDFSNPTKDLLAKRVSYRCSNPYCRQPTSGPQADPSGSINVGVAAHITAASPDGSRYDPALTSEQRRAPENGLWLCQTCGKLVDNDPVRYTVGVLKDWKRRAEALALQDLEQRLAFVPTSLDESLPSLRLKAQAPAMGLITRAKDRWKYPDSALALRMELIESIRPSSEASHPIGQDELMAYFREGTNLLLVGEAGVGKTTTLIALSEKLLTESDSPLPVFVDAATWASSKKTLLEHIASFSVFADAGLRAEELSRLNEAGNLLIVINGWNEIGANVQADARERLQQFLAGSSAPRVVVAARFASDSLGIPNPKKVMVRGFTWEEQKAFIRQELPEDRAGALLTSLRINSKLRSVTKNPLVLSGVISLHKSGQVVPDTLFDLLAAIVDVFEAEGQRATVLKSAPLRGCQRAYLEAIAEAMNSSALTLMPETDARIAVVNTGRKLVDQGMLAQPPEPSDVLEVLCSQHLLHRNEDSALRFAHQRFQEFFSANVVLSRLETALTGNDKRKALQTEILNCPFWEDAIELVASKLANDLSRRAQAGLLLEIALPVDLGYASQLAGTLGIASDGGGPWQNLHDAIEQMHHHAAPEAKQYALHCAAATHSPEFAPILWPLLESDNQQVRLTGYRLAGGLTIEQLGPEALVRMAKWPDERRTESIWEFAHRPENLEVIERLAQTEPSSTARAAAIGVLDFYYLASDVALAAWWNAPNSVKEADHALSMVLELWQPEDTALTNELVTVARGSANDSVKRKVGLRLLGHADEIGAEAARNALREQHNERIPSTTLVAFLKTIDSDFLKSLALECLSQGKGIRDWMRQEFLSLPDNERDDLVLATLERLAAVEHGNFDAAVPAGATESLIERLLDEGLRLAAALWSDRISEEVTRRRFRAVDLMLSHVPASSLIDAVLRRADSCSYDDFAWIAEMLDKKARSEDLSQGDGEEAVLWQPTVKNLDALIKATSGKHDIREVSSCKLEAYLASLASKTDPARYLEQVLEYVRRHALAYNAYDEALQRWIADRMRSIRPMNPPYEIWFVKALCRCGFDAVPGLLEISNEPGASHIVPQALVAIASGPWEDRRDKQSIFGSYVNDHKIRCSSGRIFQQPDAAHQPVTDEIARFIIHEIKKIEESGAALYDTDMSKQSKEYYSLWNDYKLLARIPSPIGLANLQALLLREDAHTYPYLEIAHGVIGQGATLPTGSLKAIRSLWQRETAQGWIDDNAKHRLSALVVLHFFIEDVNAGLAQLKELLPEWLKRESLWRIIDAVGHIHTREAVVVLAELLSRCDSMTDCEKYMERMLYMIASNPVPETANILLDLIEAGVFSKYWKAMFRLEHSIAPRLQEAATSGAKFMTRLLTVLESKADATHEALVCVVLSGIDDPRARKLIYRYLDEQAYPQGGHAASHALMGRFSRQMQSVHGAGWYEVYPQANNPLRQHLFMLASPSGPAQNRARALLLALEENRMESGRPVDETRHPAIETGRDWPVCLYSI